MEWIDYNRVALAVLIWRESRGEGPDGMRATAHVVANRVRAHWGDYSKVIATKNQFSSMTVLGDSQTVLWPVRPNSMFEAAMDIAWKVYDETDIDITHNALYYANLDTITSQWFKEQILDKPDEHPITAKLGNHTFYA